MLAIYKDRPHSYDKDWLDGFSRAGFELTPITEPKDFHDLTVVLHSVTAQWEGIPAWIEEQAQSRKGKLVLFLGNEYKKLREKNEAAVNMGVDAIATQLPLGAAQSIYTVPLIEVPHALNPDYFVPGEKRFQIGVRGNLYPPTVGDEDRNRICNWELWSDLNHDIRFKALYFEPRNEWLKALQSWTCMPSSEGGKVGAKCITSRHFDAIGTHTCLVMYPGYFNGILKPEHYITLNRDHSNIVDVKTKIRDWRYCLDIVKPVREYLADCHTYFHRAKQVIEWASATG